MTRLGTVPAEVRTLEDMYNVWFEVMTVRHNLHNELRGVDHEAAARYEPTASADHRLGTIEYLPLLQQVAIDVTGMRADIAAAKARVKPEPDYAAINKILAEMEIQVPRLQLSAQQELIEKELPPTTWWRALIGAKR